MYLASYIEINHEYIKQLKSINDANNITLSKGNTELLKEKKIWYNVRQQTFSEDIIDKTWWIKPQQQEQQIPTNTIKHKMWTTEKTNYSVTSNNAVNYSNIDNSSIENKTTDDSNNYNAQQGVKIWYQNIL